MVAEVPLGNTLCDCPDVLQLTALVFTRERERERERKREREREEERSSDRKIDDKESKHHKKKFQQINFFAGSLEQEREKIFIFFNFLV